MGGKLSGIVEIKKGDRQPVTKGVGPVGMSGEGLDRLLFRVIRRKESLRDVLAGVAKGSGDYAGAGCLHVPSL